MTSTNAYKRLDIPANQTINSSIAKPQAKVLIWNHTILKYFNKETVAVLENLQMLLALT